MKKYKNEYDSKLELQAIGIPIGRIALAASKEEAVKIADRMDGPYSMKIVSDQIVHKTEANGVFLNVEKDRVADVFEQIINNAKAYDPAAIIDGVIMATMIPKGVEVIIGAVRDVQFGPVVMFGFGGIFVDIYKDVQFRLAPLSVEEAIELIKSVQAFPLLDGARGMKKIKLQPIAEVIVKIGDYLNEHPEIVELDVNPLMCLEDQVFALDATIGIKI